MDPETRAHAEHAEELRLWLRMLACTQVFERELRDRLRDRFQMTLPHFDLMAQLERVPKGLRMNELSRRMMVSGGNITALTDQLEAEDLVERTRVEGDRRAFRVRLTPMGRKRFGVMARAHEGWVVDAFAGLSAGDVHALHRLLGKVKQHFQEAT